MKDRRTLSNSLSSPSLIVPNRSAANVLSSKSDSSVPRFRLWYTKRARIRSTVSPWRSRGSGAGASGGEVVFATCSGVPGSSHGSARRGMVVESTRRADAGRRRVAVEDVEGASRRASWSMRAVDMVVSARYGRRYSMYVVVVVTVWPLEAGALR